MDNIYVVERIVHEFYAVVGPTEQAAFSMVDLSIDRPENASAYNKMEKSRNIIFKMPLNGTEEKEKL